MSGMMVILIILGLLVTSIIIFLVMEGHVTDFWEWIKRLYWKSRSSKLRIGYKKSGLGYLCYIWRYDGEIGKVYYDGWDFSYPKKCKFYSSEKEVCEVFDKLNANEYAESIGLGPRTKSDLIDTWIPIRDEILKMKGKLATCGEKNDSLSFSKNYKGYQVGGIFFTSDIDGEYVPTDHEVEDYLKEFESRLKSAFSKYNKMLEGFYYGK